ncbi:MAG: Carbonic anhydrase [Pelotomaculum sp. PtaB.Bin104]|nr:MAG: Carbonic anhydrase [Pelotomaculum sp. PtaB.Bin104]
MKKGGLKILGLALLIIFASVCMVACSTAPKTETQNTAGTYNRTEIITSSTEAKQLLIDGNKRFTENKLLNDDISDTRLKGLSTNGQHPFAVIVSCSDSRVPPEVIFDQGLGDIFVIRDAGNVIDPVVLGSVEYGAEHLHAPLIAVLGHEGCGAVKATVDGGETPGSIGAIVEKIKPSMEKAKSTGATSTALYEKTADENIKAAIAAIEKSHIIKELLDEKKVKIIGAKYHLETGEVVFSE